MVNTRGTFDDAAPIQMTPAELEAMITARVQSALAADAARRAAEAGQPRTSESTRNESTQNEPPLTVNSGTSRHSGVGKTRRAPRSCPFKDFLACKNSDFHGTEGPVGLLQWFEELESNF